MKRGIVISLEEHRRKKAQQKREQKKDPGWAEALPDARELWALLDQNVDVRLWKGGAK